MDLVVSGLVGWHSGPFGGVRWALRSLGVVIEGEPGPQGTPGLPVTVNRVWTWFGPEIIAAARKHGVPAELIVATICTETAGGQTDRQAVACARRDEPDGRASVGCMQTLLSTATELLHRPELTAADLQDPALSIDAGAAYIASQSWRTRFDPPLVAAAYNAGGLYFDPVAANRWRLRCYPEGTGAHIDRFVAWFNDAMRLPTAAGRVIDTQSLVLALSE